MSLYQVMSKLDTRIPSYSKNGSHRSEIWSLSLPVLGARLCIKCIILIFFQKMKKRSRNNAFDEHHKYQKVKSFDEKWRNADRPARAQSHV